jgi:hypothetical protein
MSHAGAEPSPGEGNLDPAHKGVAIGRGSRWLRDEGDPSFGANGLGSPDLAEPARGWGGAIGSRRDLLVLPRSNAAGRFLRLCAVGERHMAPVV